MQPFHDYRAAVSHVDGAQAEVERAADQVTAAEAAVAAAGQDRREIDERTHDLWTRLCQRAGRRARGFGPVPPPDRQAPPKLSVNLDHLLEEIDAEIGVPPAVGLVRRTARLLVLPLAGGLCGALGFLLCWNWLDRFGITLAGALGVTGLLLGPVVGMILAVWLYERLSTEPAEPGDLKEQPEPWVVLLALVPALAAEAILYAFMR